MRQTFRGVDFGADGAIWRRLFIRRWPAYRRWYLQQGRGQRTNARECREALSTYMPELLPAYDDLCGLAGSDPLAHSFLSLYLPPPYLTGCSQLASNDFEPLLIRNYDYTPRLCDGLVMWSNWNRPVLAMVDCLWGALDGINDAGLSVSLAFGGRRIVGDGFGIPIVLRYILETCENSMDAMRVLQRVPLHMSYNVTAIDPSGCIMTAFCAPDRKTKVTKLPIATNYQGHVEWPEYAETVATIERQASLERISANGLCREDDLERQFSIPPLYCNSFEKGFGTLYTAVYKPRSKSVDYIWPNRRWSLNVATPSAATYTRRIDHLNSIHRFNDWN